ALLNADSRYKDVYKVSDEEKSNKIQDTILNNGTTLTQGALWSKDNTYNPVRKRLTNATYTFMANNKGDGIYETIEDGNYSYMGKPWNWINNKTGTAGVQTNWDSDYTLLGHTSLPFFVRGNFYNENSGAGVWSAYAVYGHAYNYYGFRPVLF
ncbi:MAG: hypothetical protein RSC92_02830, partial [Clostridia bacterium]